MQYFTNGLDTRTQGIDVTGELRVPAGGSGTLDLTAGFNYTKNKIIHVDPLPAGADRRRLHRAGTAGLGDRDRHRGRAARLARHAPGQLTLGRFSALGRFSYFGGFSSAQPGFCDLCRENYGGKGLVDAEVGYQFNLVKLAVGVRNLFDTYPDQPELAGDRGPTTASTSKDFNDNFGIFPWAAASPFGYNGRYVYARTEMQLAR